MAWPETKWTLLELAAQYSLARTELAGGGWGRRGAPSVEGSTSLWSPPHEWGVYQSPVRMH